MTRLVKVEGIGEVYAAKLQAVGVESLEDYLVKTASPAARAEMAEKAGISPKLILEWANHADLFRIKGIGEEYSDLLEAAGVDTVPELAQRNPENLYETLKEADADHKRVRKLPSLSQVQDWVAQAKALPRVLTY